MGERRGGSVSSLGNVEEEKRAAAAAAAAAAIKQHHDLQQKQTLEHEHDDRHQPQQQQQQQPQEVNVITPPPTTATATNATTTTTTTTVVPTIQTSYHPGIYRFRCYGQLTLHQERPLRTIQGGWNNPPTTSRMVCHGMASRLELVQSYLVPQSNLLDFMLDKAQTKFYQNEEAIHDNDHDGHVRHDDGDDTPWKIADLQHPDDVEAFIEDQRAFVWTPHAEQNVVTAVDDASAVNDDSAVNDAAPTTPSSSKKKESTNKVWNKWTSTGTTDVELLILRKQEKLSKDVTIQSFTLQRMAEQFAKAHSTKKLNVTQLMTNDKQHADDSQLLGVLPKPILGFGKHEVGLRKDDSIYTGTYSQACLFGMLQIAMFSTSTTDSSAVAATDYKAHYHRITAFWSKVLVTMKKDLKYLKGELSDDFGSRWYAMSSRILEKIPKTAEKTANNIAKFVRGYWPGDD